MDLSELKKRLYKKDDAIAERPQPPAEFKPGNGINLPTSGASQWTDSNHNNLRWSVGRKRSFWLWTALFVLLVAGLAGWFFGSSRYSFDKSRVALDIFGQERIVSGEESSYIVRYQNNTSAILKNASLTFIFPAQATPNDKENIENRGGLPSLKKTIGDIAPGQEGQIEFKTRVLGDKDSQQKFSAKLEYQPANINGNFTNQKDFSSVIISVPLILNFDLPERLVSGQTVNFSLKYINTSEAIFNEVKIRIDYPPGFNFENALPSPSDENNVWNLPEIGSRQEGKIIIKGVVAGSEGENKTFSAKLGTEKEDEFIVYAQTLNSPQISASPLFVEQIPDQQTIGPGKDLSYKLKYKNNTDTTIGPVAITLKIDSRAVDFSQVNAPEGFFNSADNTITWNASSLPELDSLARQAEGELGFRLSIKNNLPINNFSDKNFTVITIAKIDSPNVPLPLTGTQLAGTNQTTVKVNSRLTFNMKGYYTDKLIPNSGPLPPRVGQKTTYTIYWQIQNASNDLSDVSVEAYLPSYVQWQGNIYPKNENIRYEAASGKLTWQIGQLPAATGILLPVKQIAFQVGLIPSLGQIGKQVLVVQDPKISGQDTFTEQNLQVTADGLQSDMPDDQTVGWEKGRVAQ